MKDDILAEHSHRDGRVFEGSPAQRSNARTSPHILSFTTLPCSPAHTALGGGGGGEAGVVVVVGLPGGGRGHRET